VFVFTGTLTNFSRTDAQDIVRSLGGSVSTAIGKNTSVLVCGKFPGSKRHKAEKLGVKIMGEEEFKEIIAQQGGVL
jgi:DNA ligase (NAD+)